MRRPIGVKFCMVIECYIAGPKFLTAHPQKILGAKNMQNLARFRTTSNWRQISPERIKIFKIGQVCDLPRFLSP